MKWLLFSGIIVVVHRASCHDNDNLSFFIAKRNYQSDKCMISLKHAVLNVIKQWLYETVKPH